MNGVALGGMPAPIEGFQVRGYSTLTVPFAAPLGSATPGRLEFVRGAYNATIHADGLATDLYRARFEGTAPDVRAEDNSLLASFMTLQSFPYW